MENIVELRARVADFQYITDYPGYICLGKGHHDSYGYRYGIEKQDLYTDEVDRDEFVTGYSKRLTSGWNGDSSYFYYFVTADYYNQYIKEQT